VIVTLYTTSGCHLCEQAEWILKVLQADGTLEGIEPIDIATDDELVTRYGIRIPVIRRSGYVDDDELGWPFTEQDVRTFLETSDNG
jgi:hypothetical protein